MHPVMTAIKNALGYAKFQNDDVKDAAIELIEQVGVDLQADDYEPGSQVEVAMKSLDEVLNSTDSITENTDAAIASADPSEVLDEDPA